MAKKVISADCGRSATKFCTQSFSTLRVPSVHGFVSKTLLESSLVKKNELIVSVPGYKDNQIMIVGRGALDRLRSEEIIEVNETTEFLKNSIIYTLSGISEICPQDSDIDLILQLTRNDLEKYGKGLAKAFTGERRIIRYNSFGKEIGSYTYNINPVIYIQGLCSFFDLLFDNKGVVNEESKNETVLVVDVGARTTDIALVKSLSVAATASYDAGSESIFFAVSDHLRQKGVNSSAKEIEWKFLEEKYKVKSRTEEFDIKELMDVQAQRIAQRMVNFTLREFASEMIDKVILTGGSAHLFYDTFSGKDAWPFVIKGLDPQFSNAKGAMKWNLYNSNLNHDTETGIDLK